MLTIFVLAGCAKQDAVKPCEDSKRPSAVEIFNLRTKCGELGRALAKESSPPIANEFTDDMSNYSISENRCYVTLTTGPDPSVRNLKWFDHVSLYDGQTREYLASTDEKESVLDPNRHGFVSKEKPLLGVPGYEKAEAYINKKMEREQ